MQGVSSVWGFLLVFFLRVMLKTIPCIQECESREAEKCHIQENWARRKAILYHSVKEVGSGD